MCILLNTKYFLKALQLSRGRLELPARGFSVLCSNQLSYLDQRKRKRCNHKEKHLPSTKEKTNKDQKKQKNGIGSAVVLWPSLFKKAHKQLILFKKRQSVLNNSVKTTNQSFFSTFSQPFYDPCCVYLFVCYSCLLFKKNKQQLLEKGVKLSTKRTKGFFFVLSFVVFLVQLLCSKITNYNCKVEIRVAKHNTKHFSIKTGKQRPIQGNTICASKSTYCIKANYSLLQIKVEKSVTIPVLENDFGAVEK